MNQDDQCIDGECPPHLREAMANMVRIPVTAEFPPLTDLRPWQPGDPVHTEAPDWGECAVCHTRWHRGTDSDPCPTPELHPVAS